jgi:hypothetical protein
VFIGRSASKKKSRYQVERPALGRTAMRSGSASDNTSRPRFAFANMGNMRTGICRSHIGSGSAVACSKRRAAERSVSERRSAGHKIRGCNNRRARPYGTSPHRRVVAQTRRQAMPRLPPGSLGWQIFSPSCPLKVTPAVFGWPFNTVRRYTDYITREHPRPMSVCRICLTNEFGHRPGGHCPGLAFIGHDLMGFDPEGPRDTVQK